MLGNAGTLPGHRCDHTQAHVLIHTQEQHAHTHTYPPTHPHAVPRSPAGEDVVPTFTTSNDRMLLLLGDGAAGMLRLEDAERLQAGGGGGGGGGHSTCPHACCCCLGLGWLPAGGFVLLGCT
jgi:hypothetical protein